MGITLDLHEQATRKQILDTLFDAMSSAQREQFDSFSDGAGVPETHHHNVGEVNATIDALEVPEKVKEDLRGVYDILAHAEAKVHGCAVEETHFHEVGDSSGIRNALAICLAFYVLDADEVKAGLVQPGKGKIEIAHGVMDVPAPATAAIFEAHNIPLVPEADRLDGERCTPTSAAIIAHFVTSFEV
jgi:uncharacterized protein (DUF111 family)